MKNNILISLIASIIFSACSEIDPEEKFKGVIDSEIINSLSIGETSAYFVTDNASAKSFERYYSNGKLGKWKSYNPTDKDGWYIPHEEYIVSGGLIWNKYTFSIMRCSSNYEREIDAVWKQYVKQNNITSKEYIKENIQFNKTDNTAERPGIMYELQHLTQNKLVYSSTCGIYGFNDKNEWSVLGYSLRITTLLKKDFDHTEFENAFKYESLDDMLLTKARILREIYGDICKLDQPCGDTWRYINLKLIEDLLSGKINSEDLTEDDRTHF